MITLKDLRRRGTALVTASILTATTAAPLLLSSVNVSAAQFTSRSIALSSSKKGNTNTVYTATFTPGTTNAVLGMVFEFCANSPLIGGSCTAPATGNSLEAFDIVKATLSVSGWTVDTTNSTASKLVITRASGTFTSGTPATVTIGTTSNGVTNPNTTGTSQTYYTRILSYATAAGAQAYTSATPGTHLDDGGVALSTANQLTTTAKVQETLEFCVAATDTTIVSGATAPTSCTDAKMTASTSVDLGVVDTSTPVPGTSNASPVPTANGGNNRNGGFLIRTNAANGATISYKAEQDGSSGSNKGSLKVSSANCVSSSSVVDQCFNSAGTTKTAFNSAGEKFGMIIPTTQIYRNGSTSNLQGTGQYTGTGAPTDGYTWDDGGTVTQIADTLATTSKVADYEFATLVFAARAAATTPTGTYTVTSTYIATSTF